MFICGGSERGLGNQDVEFESWLSLPVCALEQVILSLEVLRIIDPVSQGCCKT